MIAKLISITAIIIRSNLIDYQKYINVLLGAHYVTT